MTFLWVGVAIFWLGVGGYYFFWLGVTIAFSSWVWIGVGVCDLFLAERGWVWVSAWLITTLWKTNLIQIF